MKNGEPFIGKNKAVTKVTLGLIYLVNQLVLMIFKVSKKNRWTNTIMKRLIRTISSAKKKKKDHHHHNIFFFFLPNTPTNIYHNWFFKKKISLLMNKIKTNIFGDW